MLKLTFISEADHLRELELEFDKQDVTISIIEWAGSMKTKKEEELSFIVNKKDFLDILGNFDKFVKTNG